MLPSPQANALTSTTSYIAKFSFRPSILGKFAVILAKRLPNSLSGDATLLCVSIHCMYSWLMLAMSSSERVIAPAASFPAWMAFFVSIFILPIFICACKVKVPASNNTHMNSFLIVVMNFNVWLLNISLLSSDSIKHGAKVSISLISSTEKNY